MPDGKADLNVRHEGDVCLVEFKDRRILDELQIQEIGERLRELVDEGPSPRLLLDFDCVEHFSSAALGVLIDLKKQIDRREGQLVLARIHPQILEVFKITRLNRLFDIQSTSEAALKAFG